MKLTITQQEIADRYENKVASYAITDAPIGLIRRLLNWVLAW